MRESKLCITNRKVWREWLKKNCKKENEVWLIYYKKHTGKQAIPYDDAVEEAICFGWIDGKVRSIDDERYMQRYTPRNPDSVWSLSNKKRAKKMIKKGLMTKAGLEKIEAAKATGKWQSAYSSKTKPSIPKDLEKALQDEKKAWENFCQFTNSQQFQYIYWILSAKRAGTRRKRVEEVVKRSIQSRKPGVI